MTTIKTTKKSLTAMARRLAEATGNILGTRPSHSQSLEILASTLGHRNSNAMLADAKEESETVEERTVYVLEILHRHGSDIIVAGSYEKARAELAEFVENWWGELFETIRAQNRYAEAAEEGLVIGDDGEEPEFKDLDPEKAIEIYFEFIEDEQYEIDSRKVSFD